MHSSTFTLAAIATLASLVSAIPAAHRGSGFAARRTIAYRANGARDGFGIASGGYEGGYPTGGYEGNSEDDGSEEPEACVDGPKVTYMVVSGDSLEQLAIDNNSGICNIAAASSLADPNFIDVGQELSIPTDVCPENVDNESCVTTSGTATCVEDGEPTYTIVAGDTLFDLAASFGITLDALTAANPGVVPENLQVGQVINVPVCGDAPRDAPAAAPTATCVEGGESTYTIVSGDTFSDLANTFGITLDSLTAANPGVVPENLQIGQVINVPVC